MGFVVEDGTGVSGANSYCSVADANSYFSDRGISEWVGTDDVKSHALVRATDFIDTTFGTRFLGEKISASQSLEFPRTLFTGIPKELLKACAEYALRALNAKLIPDPPQEGAFAVKLERVIVGPIEEMKTYDTNVPGRIERYPAADFLIYKLLKSQASVVRA